MASSPSFYPEADPYYTSNTCYVPYLQPPHFIHPSYLHPQTPPFCSIVQPEFTSSTHLLDAVSANKVSEVRNLLDTGCDVNEPNDQGWTPLMEAAHKGYCKMLEILLLPSYRAKTDLQTSFGDTALTLATHGNHTHCVSLLLDAKANTEIPEHEGCTALMLASEARDQTIMLLLLRAGANVHAMNTETGRMPIAYTTPNSPPHKLLQAFGATDHATSELMSEWFLKHRPSSSDETQVPHVWVYSWVYNYIRKYQPANLEWTFDTITEFLELCLRCSDKVYVMQMLIEGALTLATTHAHSMVVQAAKNNKITILNILLSLGVNTEEKGTHEDNTALIEAAMMGHHEIVECLLHAHANKEAQDSDGWTALMYATLNDRPRVMSKLLSVGCLKETKNKEGQTALAIAASSGLSSLVSLLLAFGADSDSVSDITGDTPLSIAAIKRHTEVLKLLVLNKASPNIINANGQIPLFCFEENSSMWNFLVANGVSYFWSLLVQQEFFSQMKKTGWVWTQEKNFQTILNKIQNN